MEPYILTTKPRQVSGMRSLATKRYQSFRKTIFRRGADSRCGNGAVI